MGGSRMLKAGKGRGRLYSQFKSEMGGVAGESIVQGAMRCAALPHVASKTRGKMKAGD